jgi:glutathione peroxidase
MMIVFTLSMAVAFAPALALTVAHAEPTLREATAGGLPALSLKTLEGKSQPLSDYRGKVLLVVNTASECGYTPQYAGLEALYQKYRARGFYILGFPSDDFHQEPGSGTTISNFCKSRYGVTFPLFEKGPVSGDAAQPLWKYLTQKYGQPKWNFFKYLIGKDGVVRAVYESRTTPDNETLLKAIEAALAE